MSALRHRTPRRTIRRAKRPLAAEAMVVLIGVISHGCGPSAPPKARAAGRPRWSRLFGPSDGPERGPTAARLTHARRLPESSPAAAHPSGGSRA
jgi:hypothetical protein